MASRREKQPDHPPGPANAESSMLRPVPIGSDVGIRTSDSRSKSDSELIRLNPQLAEKLICVSAQTGPDSVFTPALLGLVAEDGRNYNPIYTLDSFSLEPAYSTSRYRLGKTVLGRWPRPDLLPVDAEHISDNCQAAPLLSVIKTLAEHRAILIDDSWQLPDPIAKLAAHDQIQIHDLERLRLLVELGELGESAHLSIYEFDDYHDWLLAAISEQSPLSPSLDRSRFSDPNLIQSSDIVFSLMERGWVASQSDFDCIDLVASFAGGDLSRPWAIENLTSRERFVFLSLAVAADALYGRRDDKRIPADFESIDPTLYLLLQNRCLNYQHLVAVEQGSASPELIHGAGVTYSNWLQKIDCAFLRMLIDQSRSRPGRSEPRVLPTLADPGSVQPRQTNPLPLDRDQSRPHGWQNE